MASEIIVYVAVSLDGYIAAEDGTVGFLDRFGSDEYGFAAFLETVGGVVMGSATYEKVLEVGWPYEDIPGLVLTSRDLDTAEGGAIVFSDDDTGDAIRAFAETTDLRVWIVGGGEVIMDALEEGLVDTMELYVMPVALGSGIPLFPRPYDGPLRLTDTTPYSTGAVKLAYATTDDG